MNSRITIWVNVNLNRLGRSKRHMGGNQNAGQGVGRLRAGTAVMIKAVYATAVATIAAACFVAFPSLSFQVEASSSVLGAATLS